MLLVFVGYYRTPSARLHGVDLGVIKLVQVNPTGSVGEKTRRDIQLTACVQLTWRRVVCYWYARFTTTTTTRRQRLQDVWPLRQTTLV